MSLPSGLIVLITVDPWGQMYIYGWTADEVFFKFNVYNYSKANENSFTKLFLSKLKESYLYSL